MLRTTFNGVNKKQGLTLTVVVLVAILGYWLMGSGGKFAGDFFVSPTPTPSSTAKTPAKSGAKVSPVAPSKSYTELVKEYDGRRIQFDERCQAIPKGPTYKNGTSIMLDNRSGDARTVKVGDKSYNLQGYGYWIVNLSSPSLPKELTVNCGSAVNVGKILLQAMISQ